MAIYRSQNRERLTVGTTAVGMTAGSYSTNTIYALITVEAETIYESIAGTPSATVGRKRVTGEGFEVWGHYDIVNWSALRAGSTNATLEIEYFGEKS